MQLGEGPKGWVDAEGAWAVWEAGRVSVDVRVPGLTAGEVAERVAAGQVNHVPPRSGRTTWDIVRANVFTRINALLMALFVLVLVTGSLMNALFGFLIIVNSGIGMLQELKAKKTLDDLAVLGEGRAHVRRDGSMVEVVRDDIVRDDVLEIGPGDQIPVDGEVVEASYLEVDESLLTGESDPVAKQPGDEVMSGSHVVAGVGAFRATRVGLDSYASRITAEANKFALTKSELQSGINIILRIITWLMIPVGVATVLVQVFRSGAETWQELLLRVAGALVPMVPEGLVLLTSLAFAVAVVRLGQVHVLVQELPAVEGLARVDVVCADKTGTLTENGLRFGELRVVGALDEAACRQALAQLAAADLSPNASMQAIAHEVGMPTDKWAVGKLWPFTSAKKWSAAALTPPGGPSSLWVLGAPDMLAEPGSAIARQAEEIGATGRRVLLFGRVSAPGAEPDDIDALEPLALVVLEQRVRPEARDTLAYFENQNVAVKVISGDNAASVGAVVGPLGVEGEVVDARTLPEGDEAFADAVEQGSVFGRVTPQQKRRMVKALQSRGHYVAMTGDGVNDVLAIKDADLGVAMGSGAPATRAVAQVVLLDDSFATLPQVVAEGRRVIGNIERVANFFLTKTMYSILLALMVAIWRVPFPFMPIHISLVGWFTIGIPSCLLALAPNTERARHGFLGRVLRFGIPAGVIVAATTFLSYLAVLPPRGSSDAIETQASTGVLVTLLIAGTWVMVVIARPYRWWKVGMIAVCVVAPIIIMSIPLGQRLFQVDPSNQAVMLSGAGFGLAALVLIEILWWVDGVVAHEKRRLWQKKH